MLKSLISYFWGDHSSELSVDEAYTVLESLKKEESNSNEEEEKSEKENEEYSCSHKTGVITHTDQNTYVIDNTYQFESELTNLKIGMKVNFIAYVSDGKVKVSHIQISDDWDTDIPRNGLSWCTRGLIAKVVKRENRKIIISPGDITIDLNKVSSEFVPIVGDWLNLELKVEVDEKVSDLFGEILEVNMISPLRPRVLHGLVKKWDKEKEIGVIDNKIYFNRESLLAGYTPSAGDKVITEAIESEQGIYTWRALKVIPQGDLKHPIEDILNKKPDYEISIDGIYVSDDVCIDMQKLNCNVSFSFEIRNDTTNDILLQGVHFQNNNQCKLKTLLESTGFKIKPKETTKIECQCYVKMPIRDLILFDFIDFKIGRYVSINHKYEPNETYDRAKHVHNGNLLLQARTFKNRKPGDIIYGQKVSQTPRFISARLPEYPVPEKLLNIILKYNSLNENPELNEELALAKPCLSLPLRFNIYEDRFHTLLHLDEIYNLIAIRTYDQEAACFIRNGEFLMLEVENLSERRPSIIVGDRILAKNPYNPDSVTYEGYVHKVGAKHIYFKFAQMFQDGYRGEDYSVRIVSSRTTYKRLHQAVGLAVRNLGPAVLFPIKVVTKSPQVKFTYDKYDDVRYTTDKKLKDRSVVTENLLLKNGIIENNGGKYIYKENSICTSVDDLQLKSLTLNNYTENQNIGKNKSMLVLDDKEGNKRKYDKNKQNYLKVNENRNKNHCFKLEWYDKSLNYYQKEAVRNVLIGEARPLPYIIFGPPGTGKTVTIIEIILQILRIIPHSRLLVAAPSNSAADLIALRLIDSGVLIPGDLVRLVAYRCVVENSVPPKLVPYSVTLDLAKEGSREYQPNFTNDGLILGCNSTVIGRHRVTIGTCSAIGGLFSSGFSKGHFSHIIVDEAGQASEPHVMIPLSFLDIHTGQIILAGDHMQLGPVILSRIAESHGLGESYLERLINRFPYERDVIGFPETNGYDPRLVTKLIYNYRSLPEMLTVPNSLFYNNELRATISEEGTEEASLLEKVKEILPHRKDRGIPSLVFHGVIGENYQTSDSPSWFNPNEASQIFYYINEFYRLGISAEDIGIITPYIKQVRQIRALLNEAEFELPKIGTVEDFQGLEFKIILLSLVRSNENMVSSDLKYGLGFLSNPRRMNVALTRAQALTVVIGNPSTVMTDYYWRTLVDYCVKNSSYCGCALMP